MKTYFRRLWAALLGRPFTSLEIGGRVCFRSPGGTPLPLEIVQVNVQQDWDSVMRVTIEAQTPIERLARDA